MTVVLKFQIIYNTISSTGLALMPPIIVKESFSRESYEMFSYTFDSKLLSQLSGLRPREEIRLQLQLRSSRSQCHCFGVDAVQIHRVFHPLRDSCRFGTTD